MIKTVPYRVECLLSGQVRGIDYEVQTVIYKSFQGLSQTLVDQLCCKWAIPFIRTSLLPSYCLTKTKLMHPLSQCKITYWVVWGKSFLKGSWLNIFLFIVLCHSPCHLSAKSLSEIIIIWFQNDQRQICSYLWVNYSNSSCCFKNKRFNDETRRICKKKSPFNEHLV